MKHLVLTFLSTAAVCAVLSATPAAAQDTVTGAPAGEAPVTAEGYGAPLDTPARPPLPRSARLRAPRTPQSRRPSDATSLVTLMTLRRGTPLSAVPDRPALPRHPHSSRSIKGAL